MKSLANKVVWLTGASSGIGEALAYALSMEHAKLILSGRNTVKLHEVQKKCISKGNRNVQILPLDLEIHSSLSEKHQEAIRFYGSINLLINNAGVSQRSLAYETDIKVVRKIMEINFFASVALSQHVLKDMLLQKQGHIVNISSLVGKFGTPFRSSYAASKHALHGYFDSLRAEVAGKNIKITLVCPGFIKTQVSVNALDKLGNKTGEMDEAQAKGMLPDIAAQQIIKAIRKDKKEVLIGGKEKYAVYLKRFFPNVFSRIIQKAKVR